MVGMRLGDLLQDMAQLQGLNRVLALALNSEVVVSSLEHGAKEGNPLSIDIGPRMTAEEIVVVQCLFFRWWLRDSALKDEKELAKWCRIMAEHPKVWDIPGLGKDVTELLEKSTAQRMRTDRDEFEKEARKQFTGCSAGELLELLWLADSVPPFSLPPGHRFWELLGVGDQGDWNSLTGEQQVKRALQRLARSRGLLARALLPSILRQLEKGSGRSISSERTVPLSEGLVNLRRLGGLRVPDWRDQIEERDAVRRLLDDLVNQVRLTKGEVIVLAGMRAGYTGESLSNYAVDRGVASRSVPVLKSRLMTKLKKAARQVK